MRDLGTPLAPTFGKKPGKGYRKHYKEEEGSTDTGRRTVVDVYRPKRNVSKTIEKDVIYKSKDNPRTKFTSREVTKRYKDRSIKSYKLIRRKNGKLIDGASKKKIKYKRGEKPDNLLDKKK
jgi:hypothetical protein